MYVCSYIFTVINILFKKMVDIRVLILIQ